MSDKTLVRANGQWVYMTEEERKKHWDALFDKVSPPHEPDQAMVKPEPEIVPKRNRTRSIIDEQS